MYADEIEDDEKELEHSSLQEKLDMELKELDKKLEQKEVKIIIFCVILSLLPRFTCMFQFKETEFSLEFLAFCVGQDAFFPKKNFL